MMKKSAIFILMIILSINIALGLEFDFSHNVTGVTNQEIKGQIRVYYDNETVHRFPIYNITVSDMEGFTFIPIKKLNYNETGYINYTYINQVAFDNTTEAVLSYLYLVNTTKTPTEEIIEINPFEIDPANKTIYQNDTIIWLNTGGQNHTITNINNLGDTHRVDVGKNYTRLFQDIGTFDYYDQKTNMGGIVYIRSNIIETYSHSPNYDSDIQFNIGIENLDAQFEIDLIPSTFSMKYNDRKKGVIRLSGNSTLYSVHLEGQWLTFEENDFDTSEDMIFYFNITPKNIDQNDETNKTYNITLEITTDNAGILNTVIPIFIEYHDFRINDSLGDVVLIPMTPEQTFSYCNRPEVNWTGICSRYLKNNTVKEYVPRVLHPDINETTVAETLITTSNTEEGINRANNKIEELATLLRDLNTRIDTNTDEINTFKEEYRTKLDNINNEVETKRKDTTLYKTAIFLFILSVIIVSGVFGVIRYKKANKIRYDLKW